MLKFNPTNYLNFITTHDSKLQATFVIINPSNNCSAPFKVFILLFISNQHNLIFLVFDHIWE